MMKFKKKSIKLLSEEELPLDTANIIQEAEAILVSKKEIAEKNEGIIIKDGDADTKKIKKIKINQDLKKDFIDAKEETLKINHFINEQKKQLELLHEEVLEIDQEMLNFEKYKNQLQVEFIDKQKKLIDKNEEEIKKLKILNQEYQEKISELYAQRNKLMTEADIDISDSLFEDTVCLSHNNLLEAISQFKEQGLLSEIEEETERFEKLLLKESQDVENKNKIIDKKIKDIQKIQKVSRLEFERAVYELLPEIKTNSTFYNNQIRIELLGRYKEAIFKYLHDNNILFHFKNSYQDIYIVIENIIIRDFCINDVKINLDIIEVIERVFKIKLTEGRRYKSVINPLNLKELTYLLESRSIYFDLINKGEKPPIIVPYIKDD